MKAELIEATNSDLTVVNAARVSFAKESDWEEGTGQLPKADIKLINYLAKHNHWTPFSHPRETFILIRPLDFAFLHYTDIAGMVWAGPHKIRHSIWGWANLINQDKLSVIDTARISSALAHQYPHSADAMGLIGYQTDPSYARPPEPYQESHLDFIDVTIRETVPLIVARQRFKHMVGFTYNEVSRRYVDDTPEFLWPEVWRNRPEGSVKQGSGDANPYQHIAKDLHDRLIRKSQWTYQELLKLGIAPEQARMDLLQAMYTSYYVTAPLTAWARAYRQRIDAHAQKEIQDLARQWDEIIRPLYPEYWSMLVD